MTHRVVRIELKQFREKMYVRAMGSTGRGTKFLIRQHIIPLAGRSIEAVAKDRDLAIEELLNPTT